MLFLGNQQLYNKNKKINQTYNYIPYYRTSYVMNLTNFWVKQESVVVQVLANPAITTTTV